MSRINLSAGSLPVIPSSLIKVLAYMGVVLLAVWLPKRADKSFPYHYERNDVDL